MTAIVKKLDVYVFVTLLSPIICHLITNVAQAQFVLGTPVNLGSAVNSSAGEVKPFLSDDGLTLYFNSNRDGGAGRSDIWFSTRDSIESEWNQPTNFAAINTSLGDLSPSISLDGLSFYYDSGDPDNVTRSRILSLSRDSTEDAWGPPIALPEPIYDAVANTYSPSMSADGLSMLFHSDRANGEGNSDLWEATRPSLDEPWTVNNLGPNVNTPVIESNPRLSPDRLTLIFGSNRTGGEGGLDIWMSTRESVRSDWRPATNLGPIVNTPGNEQPSQWWEPGNLLLFKSGGGLSPGLPGLPGEGDADMFYVRVVPEPNSASMILLGLFMLVRIARRTQYAR